MHSRRKSRLALDRFRPFRIAGFLAGDYHGSPMKTTTKKVLMGIAVAGLFFSSAVSAQKTLNLSAFKGKYTGNVTLRDPEGSLTEGRATVAFTVQKKGKAAKINYRATFPDGMGGSNVLPTVMTLSPNKRVSVTDLLVGIAGTNNAKGGKGDWRQRRRTLTFTATNGEGISLQCRATAKDIGKRRELVLKLTSTDPGGSYVFTSRLRSKLP